MWLSEFVKKRWGGSVGTGALARRLLVNKLAVPYQDHNEGEVAKMAAVVDSHYGKMRSAGQAVMDFVIVNSAVSTVVSGVCTSV